ncbi:PaaI family thioesterase [Caenimonas sedimenti]|uniref:Medium/long-chain acyl-CoA thioesterase YigI n=1 Tax=Caenimonas sedimenti TaxID=2596921 RepID=A0A562ZR44_9BURK|nr:PaaI family thioesterase [Caenimonas sedimenti]TWO71013.1 PaaI family thioesterase [Caenimonas sedimenti]
MNDDIAARALVERVTSSPGYTSAVGTQVALVERGSVHLRLARRPDLLQFNGHFHGGVIAGLADHAAGAAVTTALPPGRIAVTVDLHVNYLSPASGEAIVAKARAVRMGASICVASVEVMTTADGQEQLAAIATATLRAVDLPPLQPG